MKPIVYLYLFSNGSFYFQRNYLNLYEHLLFTFDSLKLRHYSLRFVIRFFLIPYKTNVNNS